VGTHRGKKEDSGDEEGAEESEEDISNKEPTNAWNEDDLTRNCFYVTCGKLFGISSKAVAKKSEQMQPSDDSAGEVIEVMREICKKLGFELSTSLSAEIEDEEKDYGVAYTRKDGSGHCVLFEKGHYYDYQENGQGTVVDKDVKRSKIRFYFWKE
jgi:hypothetical protein